ncbi:MAG: o-succinylbenzoate synthase [Eggerthellaceae bacterium]|nr:o-succinylbenzoate synthase [Eggerthellaceae bacterium]
MPAPTKDNFAATIESRASEEQDYVCFLFGETGEVVTYSDLRLRGVWLARELEAQHVERGSLCAVDMDNCPALIYALAAAAYGGFTLVFLNARLTETEKRERLGELKRATGAAHIPLLHESTALSLVAESYQAGPGARNQIANWARRGVGAFDDLSHAAVMFTSGTSGRPKAAGLTWKQLQGAARASNEAIATEGEGIWQLALPAYHVGGLEVVFRSVLNRNAFLLYRSFDAEKILADAYTYSATHISVVDKMLQDLLAVCEQNAGGQTAAKDQPEEDVQAAAEAQVEDDGHPIAEVQPESNDRAVTKTQCEDNDWAVAKDQPEDEALRSLEGQPVEQRQAQLSDYECILLGGSRPNRSTVARALEQKGPVFVSYGMTETCSYLAYRQVEDPDVLFLSPLPGYELTIAAPGEDGFGQLGVKGPGVIDGYMNAQTAFTADGYFLTGDRARVVDGTLEVLERSSDMFVSGGENIYPAEVRDKILAIEGVTDAHVFGASDSTWGRRPVAFVEAQAAASRPGFNRFYFADEMRNRLSMVLSPVYLPDQFVVVDEFPRTGIGKMGAGSLERAWNRRIHVAKAEVWHVQLPLVAPIRTARHKLRERDLLVVRLTDTEGRTGIGECTAFATDWYLPETLVEDLPLVRDKIAPLLVGRVLLHPSEATELFENVPGALERPLACAALENALWDLYGKVCKRSIRHLIGARTEATEPGSLIEVPSGCVLGGAVVGIGSIAEVLCEVDKAVAEGYRRVKLKIKPGHDLKVVEAVRAAYPHLMLMLDANQSYKDSQLDVFKEMDAYDVVCVEEPIDPTHAPAVGPTNLFDRLARLQATLRMRVCLDESWTSAEQLYGVLESHPELRCVSVKIGKFGSASAALDFHSWARERGIEVWPGGMFDTGISKRLHAAFGLLPGVNLPGDISDSARYFKEDLCDPPLALSDGVLEINPPEHPYGLGCALNEEALSRTQVGYWKFE